MVSQLNAHAFSAMQNMILKLEESKELIEVFLEKIPSAFFVVDDTGMILKTNNNGAQLIADSIESAIGMSMSDIFSEKHWQMVLDSIKYTNCVSKQTSFVLPLKNIDGYGDPNLFCWELERLDNLKHHDSGLTIFFGQDVTEQKELQAKITQLFNHAPIGIFSLNAKGFVTDVISSHMNSMFEGISFNDVTIHDLLISSASDAKENSAEIARFYQFYQQCISSINENKKLVIEMTFRENLFRNAEPLHYQFTFFPIYENDSFIKIIGLVQDFTSVHKEKMKRIEMEKQAQTDHLTGVSNRAGLMKYVQVSYQRCKMAKQPMSAIFIDIDYFKLYNDHYGHQQGDDCLVKVADLIKSEIDDHTLLARYGGEEFLIVMPNKEISSAQKLAEKIRIKIEDSAIEHEKSKKGIVTVSMGVAVEKFSEQNSADESLAIETLPLVLRADKALYIAKNGGRNRIVVFDEKH